MTKHRTALITGASSGIGRGLALWLAKQGTHVVAAARRTDKLQELVAEAKAQGGSLEALSLDVTDVNAVNTQLPLIDERLGGIDLVVANAGIARFTQVKKLKWPDIEAMIQTNVTGAAATLTALIPRMIERQRGQLVGIASIAGYRGMHKHATYSASKAFLATFLESLRMDLEPLGIEVTSVHPGYVKSEMTAGLKGMPFLVETDDAVARIGRAIVRGEAELHFPLPLTIPLRALTLLPTPLWNRVARKL